MKAEYTGVSSLFFMKADSEETESLNSDSSCDEEDLDFDDEENMILTSKDDHGIDLGDQVRLQFQSKSQYVLSIYLRCWTFFSLVFL